MKYVQGKLFFSPSDLVTFAQGPFSSWCNRALLEGVPGVVPDGPNALNELLQQKGLEHETKILAVLERRYGSVVKIDTTQGIVKACADTKQAMKSGAKAIYQAAFQYKGFSGYADFLIRVKLAADGSGIYEPADSKLSGKIKWEHIIQLCAYADLMRSCSKELPDRGLVGLRDSKLHAFSIRAYWRDYLKLKKQFLKVQRRFNAVNCPDVMKSEKLWRWKDEAKKQIMKTDSLVQVDKLRNSQIGKLKAAGIYTMADLAEAKAPPYEINREQFKRIRQQAMLQAKTKLTGRVVYEIRTDNLAKTFHSLPAETKYDIYFDFEGFPFFEMTKSGLLEYMCGVLYKDDGKAVFKDFWSHDREQEQGLFNELVEFIYCRWIASKKKMRAYHYGSYEVTALKRLAKRYGAGSSKFQEMNRAKVFVNVQSILNGVMKVGSPGLGLKKLESLYGFTRNADLNLAQDSMTTYAAWIKKRDGETPSSSPTLKMLHDYNREDCHSLVGLTKFLREVKDSGAA